jgi:monoamine oxidase
LSARAVILTPSTGVLAAGGIRFTPDLPAWKQDAIAALPMGAANKIAFAFAGNPFDGEAVHFAMVDGELGQGAAVYIDPAQEPMATLFLGGAEAMALERAGAAAMLAYGRDRIAALFGSDILQKITAGRATAWQSDPFVAGAYAVTRPGHGDARAALIRPVADRLFFAGEAASLDSFATAHGAHLSGIAAVEAVRAVLPG